MAKVRVAHNPALTKEQVQEIFARHFDGTYRVASMGGPFRDFLIEKNPFVGVAVKLEQTGSETRLIFNGFSPRWWARVLLGALIGIFLWRGLEKEVRAFIESSPELNAPQP